MNKKASLLTLKAIASIKQRGPIPSIFKEKGKLVTLFYRLW